MPNQKIKATTDPASILVLPFADGIGDFVNMQPLLAAIARRYPLAEVSVAASAYAHLLTPPGSPVKVVTPSWFEKKPGPVAQTLRHFVPQSLLARLAAPVLKSELGGNIDLIINTILLWEQRMDFTTYWTPQIPPRPGAVHTLDCIAEAIEQEFDLPIPRAQRFPRLVVRPEAKSWANDYASRFPAKRPLVALVPESNMTIKKWQPRAWAFVYDQLLQEGFQPLIFGPADSLHIAQIKKYATRPVQVVSTSLDNVTALLELCALAIGVDTGLLHIASAVGTRWIGLFGPTNPDVTGPYDRSLGKSLVAPYQRNEACRSCWKSFKYEDDECHALQNPSCMVHLEQSVVLDAALDMLPVLAQPAIES